LAIALTFLAAVSANKSIVSEYMGRPLLSVAPTRKKERPPNGHALRGTRIACQLAALPDWERPSLDASGATCSRSPIVMHAACQSRIACQINELAETLG
jgi:hypothetical protein